jgi:uncharacterized protein (TIGR00251 family)
MPILEDHPDGLVLRVRVQPRASRNKVAGPHGDAVKIHIAAPPVEGEANRSCLRFLAKTLKVPAGSLEILSGQTARDKRILLRFAPGVDPARLRTSLEAMVFSKDAS